MLGRECQQDDEAIVPDKIIKVATGEQSLSAVGEWLLEKKHKKRQPSEWDSEKKKRTKILWMTQRPQAGLNK